MNPYGEQEIFLLPIFFCSRFPDRLLWKTFGRNDPTCGVLYRRGLPTYVKYASSPLGAHALHLEPLRLKGLPVPH